MRDELNQMMQNGHFCPSANLKAKLVSIGGSAKEWKAEYEAMSKHRKKLSTWVLSANTILVRQADFIKAIKRQKCEHVDSLRRHLKCIQGSGAVDDPPKASTSVVSFSSSSSSQPAQAAHVPSTDEDDAYADDTDRDSESDDDSVNSSV